MSDSEEMGCSQGEWPERPLALMEKSSSHGPPTGSMDLMSELQTKREVKVDKGCFVVIRSLGGQIWFERVIEETFPFVLFTQVLLRKLICLAAQRLRVPAEVLEESGTCKIHWQELSSANMGGIFYLGSISSLSDEALDELDTKMNNLHETEACMTCFGPCDYARTFISQLGNCVRCQPCYLCPLCKVYIKEQPVCYMCIDWENDDARVLPDRVRQRILFLTGTH